VLNNEFMVRIGDFSYSLYLAHWPLFVFHRYLHPHQYDMEMIAGRQVAVKRKIVWGFKEHVDFSWRNSNRLLFCDWLLG
jgi:hypothetical protein